jgi:hypothetical protein
MDYVNKFTRGHNNAEDQQASNPQQTASEDSAASGGGGFLSKISNKLNSGLGGGPESEKNEDLLDKGISTPSPFLIPCAHLVRPQHAF